MRQTAVRGSRAPSGARSGTVARSAHGSGETSGSLGLPLRATTVIRPGVFSGSAGTQHSDTLVKPTRARRLRSDAFVGIHAFELSSELQSALRRSADEEDGSCSNRLSPR